MKLWGKPRTIAVSHVFTREVPCADHEPCGWVHREPVGGYVWKRSVGWYVWGRMA
jgi:hypothetical protein